MERYEKNGRKVRGKSDGMEKGEGEKVRGEGEETMEERLAGKSRNLRDTKGRKWEGDGGGRY